MTDDRWLMALCTRVVVVSDVLVFVAKMIDIGGPEGGSGKSAAVDEHSVTGNVFCPSSPHPSPPFLPRCPLLSCYACAFLAPISSLLERTKHYERALCCDSICRARRREKQASRNATSKCSDKRTSAENSPNRSVRNRSVRRSRPLCSQRTRSHSGADPRGLRESPSETVSVSIQRGCVYFG